MKIQEENTLHYKVCKLPWTSKITVEDADISSSFP